MSSEIEKAARLYCVAWWLKAAWTCAVAALIIGAILFAVR